jgi:hypothetical protein
VSHRELSPRSLASLIGPEWRFDAPVLRGGWALTDVYALGTDRVVIELRADGQTLRIAIRPMSPRGSMGGAAGLSVSWMAPGPADAGAAACRVLTELFGTKLGAGPRWVVPSEAELLVPEILGDEVRVEPARLEDDPDHALLAKDARQYERLFESAPRPVRITTGESACPGVSLHYPAPRNGAQPPSGRLYPVPQRFHRRRFRGYFASLGCVFRDGVPRTVPTPSTFERAVMRTRGSLPPLRPHLVRGWRGSISGRAWIARIVRERVLPVPVAPRWAVELHRAIRRVDRLATIPVDVGMLAHDVSLHALGLHAVDAACWEALIGRARERLRRGSRARALRVAAFFEGLLTRTAWEVWNEIDEPEDFASAFARRTGEVEAELARA